MKFITWHKQNNLSSLLANIEHKKKLITIERSYICSQTGLIIMQFNKSNYNNNLMMKTKKNTFFAWQICTLLTHIARKSYKNRKYIFILWCNWHPISMIKVAVLAKQRSTFFSFLIFEISVYLIWPLKLFISIIRDWDDQSICCETDNSILREDGEPP